MARLIRVADVERLAKQGRDTLTAGEGTVLSPLARDRARELGLRIIPAGRSGSPAGGGSGPSGRGGPAGAGQPERLEAEVRQALTDALARLGDADLGSVLREVVARVTAGPEPGTEPPGAGPEPVAPVGPILAGRVALVTGASSGIGAAVAVALAEAGARVVAGTFDADPHPISSTVESVQAVGGECQPVSADVTRTDQLEAACDAAVRQWGRLDVAVANAGILWHDPIETLTDDRWRDLLDVDLGGVVRTARAAAARMTGGGSIVCVSSIAGGVFGWAEHAHYAAAKAGMLGLARSLAVEWGPRRIRVNVVLPGLIETPQSLDPDTSLGATGLRAAAAVVPLRRIGEPAEVAAAIRFLASDQASYITGQTLIVDGGISTAIPVRG